MADHYKIVAYISVAGIILGIIFAVITLNFLFDAHDNLDELKELKDDETDDDEKSFIRVEIQSQERFINNLYLAMIAALMFTFVSFHSSLVYFKKLKQDDNRGDSLQDPEQVKLKKK